MAEDIIWSPSGPSRTAAVRHTWAARLAPFKTRVRTWGVLRVGDGYRSAVIATASRLRNKPEFADFTFEAAPMPDEELLADGTPAYGLWVCYNGRGYGSAGPASLRAVD